MRHAALLLDTEPLGQIQSLEISVTHVRSRGREKRRNFVDGIAKAGTKALSTFAKSLRR